MRYLGDTTIQITPIIMGCWQAGKQYWQNIDDQNSLAAIRTAYEAGITVFDTASEYGAGHSERLVGEALKSVRQKAIIATKVFADMLRYDQVIASCERSLKNLQTDYIDLFQIHWPSGSWGTEIVPIADTMQALVDLQQQGKIRAIGVSNFSVEQLIEAQQCARIESVQPPYSLFWRQASDTLMRYCMEHNITLLAYSSLAQGLLTGKFTRTHPFPKGEFRCQHKLCLPEHYERVQIALDQLRPIAKRNLMTLGQLALTWLISQAQTVAIVGARTAEQVKENAAVLQMSLSAEDLQEIEYIGREVTQYLDADPVMWVI